MSASTTGIAMLRPAGCHHCSRSRRVLPQNAQAAEGSCVRKAQHLLAMTSYDSGHTLMSSTQSQSATPECAGMQMKGKKRRVP